MIMILLVLFAPFSIYTAYSFGAWLGKILIGGTNQKASATDAK
jgi:hypothetical protein